jgi:PKD repeat protein
MRYILSALAILAILAIPSMALAQNLPPVADAGPDVYAYTCEPLYLHGSAVDPEGDPIYSWTWEFVQVPGPPGDNRIIDLMDPPGEALFVGVFPGDYVVRLTVWDGISIGVGVDYVTIHVRDNIPPVAIATADVTEGPAPLTVQFDGSQSYDPEGAPLTEYYWSFGDGTAGSSLAVPPPHTYTVPGTYSVVILAVTDEQGAVGTATLVINVTEPGPVAYSWSDFLQPIDAPDANRVSTSVFKAGSTVPVKFRLTGDSAGITDLAATLSYAKVSNGIVGTDMEAVSTAAATTGNLFRYDSASDQYIFNWSTKGLTPGAYQLSANLGDGVSRTVIISLK